MTEIVDTPARPVSDALVQWLQTPPTSDEERQVRLGLRAFMAEATKLRTAWKEVLQALEDAGHKYRGSCEDAAAHAHDDPWLEGYRIGFSHAEKRAEVLCLILVRAMVLVENAPAGDPNG